MFDEWKLHSPDMFTASEVCVDVGQNLRALKDEIMGRVACFPCSNSPF